MSGTTKIFSNDLRSPLGDQDITLGSGVSILNTSSGLNNLGSAIAPFDSVYSNNIGLISDVGIKNSTDISFVSGLTNINTSGISANTSKISVNTSGVAFVSGLTTTNTSNISANTANIAFVSGNYINTAANLLPGEGSFASGSSNTLNFKGVTGLGNISVTSDANSILISGTKDVRTMNFLLNDGGSVISSGNKMWGRVGQSGNIVGVSLTSDEVADLVTDIRKVDHVGWSGITVGSSITSSGTPTITSGYAYEDTVLTGWDTSVNKGDYLIIDVTATPTGTTKATLAVDIEIS